MLPPGESAETSDTPLYTWDGDIIRATVLTIHDVFRNGKYGKSDAWTGAVLRMALKGPLDWVWTPHEPDVALTDAGTGTGRRPAARAGRYGDLAGGVPVLRSVKSKKCFLKVSRQGFEFRGGRK